MRGQHLENPFGPFKPINPSDTEYSPLLWQCQDNRIDVNYLNLYLYLLVKYILFSIFDKKILFYILHAPRTIHVIVCVRFEKEDKSHFILANYLAHIILGI